MTERQSVPRQVGNSAAGVVIVLLATLNADVAIASSNAPVRCDDVAELTLEIQVRDLNAQTLSHESDRKGLEIKDSANESDALSPTHYLAPRAEAVLRKVFKETTTPASDSPIAETDKRPEMNTRVPGVSDDELARYKRHMYRKDI